MVHSLANAHHLPDLIIQQNSAINVLIQIAQTAQQVLIHVINAILVSDNQPLVNVNFVQILTVRVAQENQLSARNAKIQKDFYYSEENA